MRPDQHSTPHGETPYSPTSLLRALTADPYSVNTLREDEHPAAEAAPPDNRAMRVITLLLALLLGFTVAVSVIDLRADARAEDSPRALLEQEVRETRTESDALEERQAELQAEIAEAQAVVLEGAGDGASDRAAELEQAGAGVAMSGPGTVLVLDDSVPAPSKPGTGRSAVNRVTDGDVQIAVNGLWAAGAEAVSVNGQRVSSTTAIRTAGSAVLVDFRPLSPPYRITALGDAEQLRASVDGSETGAYLQDLSSRYGIRSTWEDGEELTVPPRTVGPLREASVLQEEREAAAETLPAQDDTAAESGTEEDTP